MFTLIRAFYNWLQGGIDCVVCGRKTYIFPVCQKCKKSFFNVNKVLDFPRCKICGRELISTFETCISCREERVLLSTDSVFPLFSYRLWNKELLFLWKIHGERSLSLFFASLINKALIQLKIDYVIPVPPRKGKIKKNGWDQIDELCEYLKNLYNHKVVKILSRNSTIQQKKLNREERLKTIKDAYTVENAVNAIPEKVCLIDDVCTTGSTIECCASLLKSIGIKEVYVITLFIVD